MVMDKMHCSPRIIEFPHLEGNEIWEYFEFMLGHNSFSSGANTTRNSSITNSLGSIVFHGQQTFFIFS